MAINAIIDYKLADGKILNFKYPNYPYQFKEKIVSINIQMCEPLGIDFDYLRKWLNGVNWGCAKTGVCTKSVYDQS